MIAFDYGDWEAAGVREESYRIMFDEFVRLKDYWKPAS